MIHAVHHVAMESPDPVAALDAFADFMGGVVYADARGAWLVGPNAFVRAERGSAPEVAPVHARGIAHVCVQARDPAAARSRLERNGVGYLSEPVALGTGFHYAYARDREGRLLELETAPFLVNDPQGWFAHVAFVVRDLDRMATFYGAVCGGELRTGGPYRNNPRIDQVAGLTGVDVDVRWIVGANLTLEFWRYNAPAISAECRHTAWRHLAFACADPQAMKAKAIAAGAAPDDPPAWRDAWGAVAAVRDPEGNRIVFVAPVDPLLSIESLRAPDLLARIARARSKAAQRE